MTMMVTGHRQLVPFGHTGSPYPDQNHSVYQHHMSLVTILMNIVRQHALVNIELGDATTDFISGMAIGADQLFAAAVIGIQNEFIQTGINHTIRLIAAVPFEGQESKWPKVSQEQYHVILARAAHVEYVCPPGYAAWKMQRRNEWMVDRADRVLGVWDGQFSGGTYNCLVYARQRAKSIWVLNPQSFSIINTPNL